MDHPIRIGMRFFLVASLLALPAPRALRAQAREAHPGAGVLERAAESHRVEVALAVLVHDLALTRDQARKILEIDTKLEKALEAHAAGPLAARLLDAPALSALRDRIAQNGPEVAKPTRGAFEELEITDQLADAFEGETAQAREGVTALLNSRQKAILRGFDSDRTLVRVGLGDEALADWVKRLATLRATPKDELTKSVQDSVSGALDASGHPERMATVMTVVGQVRALSRADFDAHAVDYAARLRVLFGSARTAQTTAPPSATPPAAAPVEDQELADSASAELAGAINSSMLDARMIPVLEAYLRASPAAAGAPEPAPAPSRSASPRPPVAPSRRQRR